MTIHSPGAFTLSLSKVTFNVCDPPTASNTVMLLSTCWLSPVDKLSASLIDDPIAADARRGTTLAGPTLMKPQLWSSEVMSNHPVSVPYPLDGTGSEYRLFRARGIPIDPMEWVGDPRLRGLRLVSDFAGTDVLRGTAGVECVSCHDPHGTPNTFFLRLPKERSELCLACHQK